MILRTEFKLTLREPVGAAFSLGLPLVLLLVFGIPEGARKPDPNLDGKVPIDTVMPAITLALAVGMLAIFMLPGFMTDYRSGASCGGSRPRRCTPRGCSARRSRCRRRSASRRCR